MAPRPHGGSGGADKAHQHGGHAALRTCQREARSDEVPNLQIPRGESLSQLHIKTVPFKLKIRFVKLSLDLN